MASDDDGADKLPAGVQERISQLSAQRREAEARAAKLEERVAELAPAAKRLETLQAQLADYQRKEQAWTEERTILGAGISDPDGVDFARHAWTRLPEDKRPAGGIGEWLTQRDTLPKAVQAYLPPPPAPAGQQTQGGQQPPPAPKLPASNAGAAPQVPHGQPVWTPERVAALTPAEYAANRAAIVAEVTRR